MQAAPNGDVCVHDPIAAGVCADVCDPVTTRGGHKNDE